MFAFKIMVFFYHFPSWSGAKEIHEHTVVCHITRTEMEKRADTADISVFFLGGCANFLAVSAQKN